MYLVSPQKATAVENLQNGETELKEPLLLGGDSIKPSLKERMLGISIGDRFSMKFHLTEGEDSLVQRVGNKMRALWQMKSRLSFKARRATAYGLVLSRMLFSIEVWGPADTENQLQSMQVLQNQILRFICGARRGARTEDLVRQSGVLSVRQMIAYRTLCAGLGYVKAGAPSYLVDGLRPRTISVDTRSTRRCVGRAETAQHELSKRSFRFLFLRLANKIPRELLEGDIKSTKSGIKIWVKENIPIDSKWPGLA